MFSEDESLNKQLSKVGMNSQTLSIIVNAVCTICVTLGLWILTDIKNELKEIKSENSDIKGRLTAVEKIEGSTMGQISELYKRMSHLEREVAILPKDSPPAWFADKVEVLNQQSEKLKESVDAIREMFVKFDKNVSTKMFMFEENAKTLKQLTERVNKIDKDLSEVKIKTKEGL